MPRRYLLFATLAIAIASLYLYDLDGFGVYGPDEPRYAAIGRAMAQTGDFITPKLWGTPWFEKPPLLYWMTAAGTAIGLSPDLCGRLPVALLSLGSLAIWFVLLKQEFGSRVAGLSIVLLATSAWWLAFSALCVTDLPLAVFFSFPVLLSLPLLRAEPDTRHLLLRFCAMGASLGLAVLAKGLVPVALALPFAWFLRRFWRAWWAAFATFASIALPWYLAVYLRNGFPFIEDFFIKHHLERVYSASLLHVQPPYYYLLVFLAAVFPWTALIGFLLRSGQTWDTRRRFLLWIVIWGFLFFSIPLNKLPGYLLPLLPSFFVLLGSAFERQPFTKIPRAWLIASALLIACIPLLVSILPALLAAGKLTTTSIGPLTRIELFYIAVPIVIASLARREWAAILLLLCVIPEGLYLKSVAFPAIDANVSARSLWRRINSIANEICDGGTNRDWLFGLSYYRGATFPPCGSGQFSYALRTRRRGAPDLDRLGEKKGPASAGPNARSEN
ncbi:MAG: ArnT family glycosyltransferase [Bryobacteraceae bacterium]